MAVTGYAGTAICSGAAARRRIWLPRCSELSSSQSDSRVVPVGSRPDLDTSRSAVSPSISSWVSTTSLTSRPTILAPSIAAHGRTWTSRADDADLVCDEPDHLFVAEHLGTYGVQLDVVVQSPPRGRPARPGPPRTPAGPCIRPSRLSDGRETSSAAMRCC